MRIACFFALLFPGGWGLQAALAGGDANNELSFLVMGDWGGSPAPFYTTPEQKLAAEGMGTVAGDIGAKFVVALGDNFYFSGLDDVESKRFEKTWSNVYSSPNLNVPFLIISGNHDHKGNVSAQIEYTSRDPTKRWTYPSLFHKQSFSVGTTGATVDLILIDTVELSSMNPAADESVAGYFEPLPLRSRSEAEDQWSWIEAQLSQSTADFVLVGGHYPIYSVCEHGPDATLISNLLPLLQKYGGHYMSGHDHCANHFVDPSGVNVILTGMADTCCYKPSNLNNPAIPAGALKWYASKHHKPEGVFSGFSSVVVTQDVLTVSYHDQKGQVLFKADPIPKRKQVSK